VGLLDGKAVNALLAEIHFAGDPKNQATAIVTYLRAPELEQVKIGLTKPG
jgi:hypothetical protein